jgi:hypothetical protein
LKVGLWKVFDDAEAYKALSAWYGIDQTTILSSGGDIESTSTIEKNLRNDVYHLTFSNTTPSLCSSKRRAMFVM